jgi:hypothetical protein
MSGRARESAASATPLRPLPTVLAGLLGVSLGVLGWLSAQAATFGAAEHTHLTAHGVTTHRHDYAVPLATGAGVMALLAVLLLLLLHLGSSRRSNDLPRPAASPASPARMVGRFSPAVAALLFVAVEAVEFAGSGTPVTVAAAVLAGGAGVQVLVARVASVVAEALVHGVEHVSTVPAAPAARVRNPSRRGVAASARSVESTSVLRWGCRAPPGRHAALIPTS